MRILMNIALGLRRAYWWIVRPRTRGVRAILVNPEGNILLVTHSYGSGRYLPGGKSKKSEDDLTALRRELKEELGAALDVDPRLLGVYKNEREYKKDVIAVFICEGVLNVGMGDAEVEKYGYFNPNSLPDDTSPGTRKRIEEWLGNRQISEIW